ncbi:MAG: hypothetical protein LUH13_04660 [Oscillospiraceae bacterium]|nr:hypothetical protein [Oscillospiraceae bacterium]
MRRILHGRVLLLQLTHGAMRAAVTVPGAPGTLASERRLPLPPDAVEDGVIRSAAAVKACVMQLLAQSEMHGVRRVAFSVCSTQVISERVSVPAVNRRRLGQLLEYNMDMYFPVNPKNYHMVWKPLGTAQETDGAPMLEVQLWAVPLALLSGYYALANCCGLSVAAVDYCGDSLAAAVGAEFRALPERESGCPLPTELYLLVEEEHLLMTFVQTGCVRLQRTLLLDTETERAVGEAAMVLEYYRTTYDARGALHGTVCGARADDRALLDALRDALGLAELPVSPAAEWCVLAGASRMTLDYGVPALNRPERAQRRDALAQYALVALGAAALIAMLLLTTLSRMERAVELSALQNTRTLLSAQMAPLLDASRAAEDYAVAAAAFEADKDTLLAATETANDHLPLLLQELEETLPVSARIVSAAFGETEVKLELVCDSKETAAYLIQALRGLKYAALQDLTDLDETDGAVCFDAVLSPSGALLEQPLERPEMGTE